MARARRSLRTAVILGAAGLVAAGCGGGGEEAVVTPAAGTDPSAPGTVVGQPGATDPATGQPAATDPATGQPVDPALGAGATDAGASSATVPDLVGDDVVGGLEPVANTPLFDAQAVATIEKPKVDDTKTDAFGGGSGGTSGDPEKDAKPAVTYTGAKIYVDGITHTVNASGTFPKGNPVFRLLSVNANEIEIDLVAGEFTSSGGTGTFLDKGDLVSMVNASEQVTYRVKYLRPITSSSDISF